MQAPHLTESDSPQVQNPLSTNNNKGGSVLNPPKPTINLVPEKDIPGVMLPPAGTQRTIIRPVRHTIVNQNF